MIKVKDVYDFIDKIAPFKAACDWDNVGLLVGSYQSKVEKCVIALDLTSDIINDAIKQKADLIITHHPIMYEGFKKINDDDFAYTLIKNNINHICAHTNLDIAQGGINDVLSSLIGLENKEALNTELGLGRIGYLKQEVSAETFAKLIKQQLGAQRVKLLDTGKNIKKVAVNSGAGASDFDYVIKNKCDAFITSEIKHHMFLQAKEIGINLIDAGHFETENIICEHLKSWLEKEFFNAKFVISQKNKLLTKYI